MFTITLTHDTITLTHDMPTCGSIRAVLYVVVNEFAQFGVSPNQPIYDGIDAFENQHCTRNSLVRFG